MSLTIVKNNYDLVEFNKNKYFFRIANILLENNKNHEYVDYLIMLNEISEKIQDFYINTISNVYTECHNDGSIISTINNDLLDTIQSLNKTIINMLMIFFQSNNYESDRYNSNIQKELINVYRVINEYDFDYYMNKANDDWSSISLIVEKYMEININYFNEEEDDFNPITKLLTFFDSKPKKTKQLTGNYQVRYIENGSNHSEEVRPVQSVKKKNSKKSKNKSNSLIPILGGICVAGAWFVSSQK